MNRRAFIQSLAASAGLAAVPSFAGISAVHEPIEFIVRRMNHDSVTAVAAKWMNPHGVLVRKAVRFDDAAAEAAGFSGDEMLSAARDVLRAWYRDVGSLKTR